MTAFRPDEHDLEPLAADLRRITSGRVNVPAAVDDIVLTAANRRLRRQPRWRRAGLIAAVLTAAICVFAARLNAPATGPSGIVLADVDHSGTVDILDAFMLARLVETTGARFEPGNMPDLNGDGVVDTGDVDMIARQAVALGAAG